MSLLSQKKSFLVEILLLVLFVLVLNIALYTLIRLRQNTNEFEINSLTERNSRWKELTDDPCKWAIMGDPLATENSFVKLNIYCEDGKSSINTYDLRGIKTNNVAELISKHSSLHGINEVSFGTSKYLLSGLGKLNNGVKKWNCFLNKQFIVDYKEKIKPRDQIDCYFVDDRRLGKLINEFSEK